MTQEAQDPSLNADQQRAADGFFQFLFSDEKECIISGGGGVGKSHLMGYLIDKVMPMYMEACDLMGIKPEYTEVEMTATTNKAADVLSLFIGRPVSTIHSFMNLKVVDDYKTGESKLSKGNLWKVHEKIILFIDECSIADRVLISYVREGTHKCKIVWVGDHCQLGPIKESISPLYTQTPEIPQYNLTIPMRTKNPVLQAVNAQLRQTVETGIFTPIKIVPGVIDLLDGDDMTNEIAKHFAHQTISDRILAYQNSRVKAYNDHVRELRQLPYEHSEGEVLVNNAAVRVKNAMLTVEEEVEIQALGEVEDFEIDAEVTMDVRRATLISGLGRVFTDVLLPADRRHMEALLSHYKKNKQWAKFFLIKNTIPDLRPRDAGTVHKAQGSSYDTVFIDLEDLSKCPQPVVAARLLYVAFSRARNRVVLYGNLAEKYGGLIY